jgi:uncharacterized protein (DUF2062 family)
MPRKLLKRILPDHHVIRSHRNLRLFGTLLHDPNLWHLSRRSVPGALSVGLFVAFIPIPFQMVLAAAVAIPLRVNLPVAASTVWITNPFTMPPLFFLAYKLGAWLLHVPTRNVEFKVSVEWLTTTLGTIWEPFLLGCFLFGTASALAGNLLMRMFWRVHVIRSWQTRRRRRLAPRQ